MAKTEGIVTANATPNAYEPRYIRLDASDNVAIVVNDLGLPAKTRFACGLDYAASCRRATRSRWPISRRAPRSAVTMR